MRKIKNPETDSIDNYIDTNPFKQRKINGKLLNMGKVEKKIPLQIDSRTIVFVSKNTSLTETKEIINRYKKLINHEI